MFLCMFLFLGSAGRFLAASNLGAVLVRFSLSILCNLERQENKIVVNQVPLVFYSVYTLFRILMHGVQKVGKP